jgi:uncharacterized membrane-anchored protein YhcB (DUF1043 family)
METIYLIVTVVGFIILGCYQRHYIKALERQIKTQKDILDSQNKSIENLKMHVEIFQPDKIHEFVKMRETTFEDKKAKEIDKIRSKIEEKSKKSSNALRLLINEYSSAISILFNLTSYVQPNLRQSVLEREPDSETKTTVSKNIDEIPYYYDELAKARRKALSGEGLLSQLSKPQIEV